MTQNTESQPRTILITGASQGIGLAYAQAFAQSGANVVMADIRGAEQAAAGLSSSSVIGVTGDVTDAAQAQAIVQSAIDRFGRLDILVNNAAFYAGLNLANFEQISEADWDRSMNVNVKGVWLMCRVAAPQMRSQGWGRIINVASNVVFMGKPNFLHYVTSKGAVWALTNAMSRELAGTGITVNCVAPGYTITPATREMGTPEQVAELERQIIDAQSVKRLLEPEDMVGAVRYLASEDAAMVTGQTIIVDGGVIVG
ncbi:MAG: glucose 1-dehydrogenase [Actinomycetales bacterium]|nr:glucose 1-dehydrogenase [Actinomycetales bacterium]